MPSEPTPPKISDVPTNPHPPGPSRLCSHLTICVLMGQISFLIAYSGERSKHDYDYIIQYVDEDMVLVNNGKFKMVDLPNIGGSGDDLL